MISTVKGGSGGGKSMRKSLEPGNQEVKIVGVRLTPGYLKDYPDAYSLIYIMESKPVGGNFEGFLRDKNDPSLGTHEGKVSWVKAAPFPFINGTNKFGKEENRDENILKSIKSLCIQTGCYEWFKSANNQYESIEEFVEAFDQSKVYEDKWLYTCIQGDQYEKNGYMEWGLSLPYSKAGRYPYASVDGDQSKVIQFDEKLHIKTRVKKSSDDDIFI